VIRAGSGEDLDQLQPLGGPAGRALEHLSDAHLLIEPIAGPLAVSWFARSGGSMDAVLISAAVLLVGSAAAIGFSTLKEGKPVEALPE